MNLSKFSFCTVQLVGEKMPELLDFPSDLVHLEAASKVPLLFMLALLFFLFSLSLSV